MLARHDEGREEPRAPVVGGEQQRGEKRNGREQAEDEDAQPGAREPQEHRAEHGVAEGGAEIRLQDDDSRRHSREDESGNERLLRSPRDLGPARELMGEEKHERDLEELGRLEHGEAERNPAPRPVDGRAEEREAGQREGQPVEAVDEDGPSEPAVVGAVDDERGDAADHERRHLLEEIAVRIAGRLPRGNRRRAVDHHAAEERQRDERREEDLVRGELSSQGSSGSRET